MTIKEIYRKQKDLVYTSVKDLKIVIDGNKAAMLLPDNPEFFEGIKKLRRKK